MAKKRQLQVQVKILQNGKPVAETSQPLGRQKKIAITSGITGELSLPLYPLSEPINLLELKRTSLVIRLNDPWLGLITSNGEVYELNELDRSERSFELFSNDYASIQLHDLNVLVKVCEPLREKVIPRDPKYAPSLISLFAKSSQERNSFLLATLIALIFIGSASAYFTARSTARPTSFEQLDESYTLPFLHADNLRTSPEALQENLDRRYYIQSVIKYYRAFSSLYLGLGYDTGAFFPPMVTSRFARLYESYGENLSLAAASQSERVTSGDPAKQPIWIPSVMGESFQQRLVRMIGQIRNFHTGLDAALRNRRSVARDFRADPEYDWTNYSSTNNTNVSEELAKIKVFSKKNNEEGMYEEASILSRQARQIRQIHDLHRVQVAELSPSHAGSLVIKSDLDFIDVRNQLGLSPNTAKLDDIAASRLGRTMAEKIREPLIGKIDPKRIRAVIVRNRYKINLCYERALRKNHILRGTTDWSWRIDSRGKVGDLDLLRSTVEDAGLIRCIQDSLSTWKFPKPARGSIKITHSFVFEPQNG